MAIDIRATGHARLTATLVAAVATAFVPVGAPAHADSSACVFGLFRAGSHNTITMDDTDMNGVRAMVDIPLTYNFRNVDSDTEFSAGDLYGRYGSDFVQFGWNYGWTDDAHPFTTAIHPFIGEYSATASSGEVLKYDFSRSLTPGTSHLFELRRNEDPASADYRKFFGFIDGVAVLKTSGGHVIGFTGTTGEVDWRCHGLRNSVVDTAADGSFTSTIRYRRRSTNAWYYWGVQTDEANDTCLVATRFVTATANDFSTFASNCPQN